MAPDDDFVRVRMYRVGFGESFLISVVRGRESCHILVDCGVHGIDLGTLDDTVADIEATSDGRIALVIATHRHSDHIAGFARCADRFARIHVDEVWMSWWDDPDNEIAARAQAELTRGGEELESRLAAAGSDPEHSIYAMAENVIGQQFTIAGGRARVNEVALDVLRGGRFANKPTIRYVKAGDRVTLPAPLVAAGLSAEICGPFATPAAISAIARAGAAYSAIAAVDPESAGIAPFDPRWRVDCPYSDDDLWPMTRESLAPSLHEIAPDAFGARARAADSAINDQSIVVVFRVGGQRLLFTGDAQWQTWQRILYGDSAPAANRTVRRDVVAELEKIDLYKVAQHGRTHATPSIALSYLRDGMAAMCSTHPGRHVPRDQVVDDEDQLEEPLGRFALARSDQVAAGAEPPTPGLPEVRAPFESPGRLYIDYVAALPPRG